MSFGNIMSSKTIKNTIGLRLLKSIFGIYFFFTIILTSFQLFGEYRNEQQKVFEEASNLGEIVKDSLTASMWNLDIEQLAATLQGIVKANLVAYTEANDDAGETLASAGAIKIKNYDSLFVSKINNNKMYRVIFEHENGKRKFFKYKININYINESGESIFIGYCNIFIDHSTVMDRVQYEFLLVIINAVVKTLVLWILLLVFTKKIISFPLNVLSEATLEIHSNAKQDTPINNEIDRKLFSICRDELWILAKNFIDMRELVLEKIRVINRYNQDLEIRISERTLNLEKANKELQRLSLHDPLTGLPNRNLFHDRLNSLIDSANRDDFYFIVGSIDLRKFKEVNDRYGHQAGDAVLVELAKRMRNIIRSSDTIARMGGDEFGLIAQGLGTDEYQIRKFAEKLISCAHKHILYEDHVIMSGINLGICIYKPGDVNGDVIYKNADFAMYDAKNSEKDFAIYSRKVDKKAERHAIIASDLYTAIERKELSVFYQPIISCKDKKVIGFEALLRWNHKDLGPIGPNEFIPIAERSSVIKNLTEWVIEQSSIFLNTLNALNYNFTISINLSGRLFQDETITKILSNNIIRNNIESKQIKIELTESTIMQNQDSAISNLKKLKNLGVCISIDDFGTGYSSFSYLARFPIDELKIDKSFILDLGRVDNQLIVEAIINLAHKLSLKVVAEGVENDKIIALINKYDCDFAQGYYYCKPIASEELLIWLKETKLK